MENDWKQLLLLAVLFVMLSHHKMYQMVNEVLGGLLGDALPLVDDEDRPTLAGQTLHAVVFVVAWSVLKPHVM